jgi:Uma2 family endonuclease
LSTAEATRRYTPEDLLTLPEGDRYELVNGQLVERDMGWKSSWISGLIFDLLLSYCRPRNLGWVLPADASYQCFPERAKVRKPDTSFIRFERLPASEVPEGHCPIAPNLAVEVVSPNELYEKVECKVDEYLQAGVELVWVVNPATHAVRVHRADGTVTDFGENDEITGEAVIPGFRCHVREFFALPGEAAAGASQPQQ